MGRLDYDYKHEPILYGWTKKHDFNGGGEQKNSVWDFPKPSSIKLHPTMKPVALIENAVLNWIPLFKYHMSTYIIQFIIGFIFTGFHRTFGSFRQPDDFLLQTSKRTKKIFSAVFRVEVALGILDLVGRDEAALKSVAAEIKGKGRKAAISVLDLRKEGTDHYYDRFRGRLIFPICDEQGRVIGFSGRVLAGAARLRGAARPCGSGAQGGTCQCRTRVTVATIKPKALKNRAAKKL